jgi:hypothetical protein
MGELGWKSRSGTAVQVKQPEEFPVRLRAVRWLGRQPAAFAAVSAGKSSAPIQRLTPLNPCMRLCV